jgi:NTE family protein
MAKYKIGLALGGGGARGYAHLGILKALEEKGIKPDIISGVSAGALAGVFIASGKNPEEILEMMKKHSITDFAKVILPHNGLLSLDRMKKMLKEHLEVKTFSELKIPLYIAATNIIEGKAEYFNEGPLMPVLQASMSIPVLFAPVEIDGLLYSDGGIMDNLPVAPLLKKCRKIIAISISPIQKIKKVDGLIEMAARTFQLSVNATIKGIEEKVNVFIEPEELTKFDILATSHADEMFEIGYNHAKQLKIIL